MAMLKGTRAGLIFILAGAVAACSGAATREGSATPSTTLEAQEPLATVESAAAVGEGGEDELTARLAAITGADCGEGADAFVVPPSAEQLTQIDADVAAGAYAGNSATQMVGSEAEVMERLGAKEVVGRGTDGSLWIITSDNVGYGFQAFPTPAGNVLWVAEYIVRAQKC